MKEGGGGGGKEEERDKCGYEGERGGDSLEPSWLTREGARRRRPPQEEEAPRARLEVGTTSECL